MLEKEAFDLTSKPRLNVLPNNPENEVGLGRFPSWLHRSLPKGNQLWETQNLIRTQKLHTVCEEASCPNLLECWSKKTATFLIMGKECVRSCGFCDISHNKEPKPLDSDEPMRVAKATLELNLKHVVITMVARDDLQDGGAKHMAETVASIRKISPETTIELLVSDFDGNEKALDTVLATRPEIFNHNIETVRELTPRVRHKATYDRTLSTLHYAKKSALTKAVKSGMMLGLGETESQVKKTLRDLHEIGCDIVTMGQYLQPNQKKLLVKEFIHPDQFVAYAAYGKELGIPYIYAGPFVRSSYNAEFVFTNAGKTL